jgi:hypothetical protein
LILSISSFLYLSIVSSRFSCFIFILTSASIRFLNSYSLYAALFSSCSFFSLISLASSSFTLRAFSSASSFVNYSFLSSCSFLFF